MAAPMWPLCLFGHVQRRWGRYTKKGGKKTRNPSDRLFQILDVRQEYNSEMIGLWPVESCSLHQEHLFFEKEVQDHFRVIFHLEPFLVDLGEEIERAVIPGIWVIL